MFQAVNILSGNKQEPDGRCGSQVQECWEFEHPRRDVVVDTRGKSDLKTSLVMWDSLEGAADALGLGIPLTNNHNVRSARLRFWIPHAGVLQ